MLVWTEWDTTMLSDNTKRRDEWREMGFFCDRDDQRKEWRFLGSMLGLLGFRDTLLDYIEDPVNDYQSEHEHYGPNWCLEIMTWPEPGFDHHAIRGSILDLKRLADIVEKKLVGARPGQTICIKDEFATDTPYSLILDVRDKDFDPAEADPVISRGLE